MSNFVDKIKYRTLASTLGLSHTPLKTQSLDLDALCSLVEIIIGISSADWEGVQKVHLRIKLKS